MTCSFHATTAFFAALFLPVSFATAQSCFDFNPGATVTAGDETVSTPVPLGFPFIWPDGTTSTDAVVTSNGRISSGASGIIPSFTVGSLDFLLEPMSIAAAWVDLDFSASGSITYFADPGGNFAVFTFTDAIQFASATGNTFSMQVQLNSDSTFALRYDARVSPELDGGPAVAGFTSGNAAVDPGGSDLSTTMATPIDTGMNGTAYKDFGTTGVFDLGETELLCIPNSAGGYTILSTPCLTNPGTVDLGGACDFGGAPPVGYRYLPDGFGGYTSIVDPSIAWDSNIGPSIGADIDTVTPVSLGFPFTMPAGTVVMDLNVDSNGRLFLPTSTSFATFSPDVIDMEAEEQIAIHWSDWLTALAGGTGDIHFTTDGVGRAVVTWNGTQQCIPVGSVGFFQCVLFGGTDPAANSFTILYQQIEIDPTNANTLIGTSDGTTGTTELDLFPGPVNTTTAGGHWEFFDILVPEIFDIQPLAPGTTQSMFLTNTSAPTVGTSFDLSLTGIPATAAFGGFGIGFLNLNAPLSIIDPTNPCTLFSSLDLLIPITPGAVSASASIDLTGAGPSIVGLVLTLQGIVGDFTLPYNIQVVTSNGLSATIM